MIMDTIARTIINEKISYSRSFFCNEFVGQTILMSEGVWF